MLLYAAAAAMVKPGGNNLLHGDFSVDIAIEGGGGCLRDGSCVAFGTVTLKSTSIIIILMPVSSDIIVDMKSQPNNEVFYTHHTFTTDHADKYGITGKWHHLCHIVKALTKTAPPTVICGTLQRKQEAEITLLRSVSLMSL